MTIRRIAFLIMWAALSGLYGCAASDGGEEAALQRRVWLPDIVSTAGATEVRLAISPDGKTLFFGRIGAPDDPDGWDIYESVLEDGVWSSPQPACFNSPDNDFDPAFAPDGRSLLFFSNRPGGEGGDDLWRVELTYENADCAEPVNLGPVVNTGGNEWAPLISPDGATLLFSSDGHGGAGGQDLFEAVWRDGAWSPPSPLAGLNTEEDDFDAAHIGENRIVFSRGDVDNGPVKLFVSQKSGEKWGEAVLLPEEINCSADINNGPFYSDAMPALFSWSAHCPGDGPGRMDIFVIDAEAVKTWR